MKKKALALLLVLTMLFLATGCLPKLVQGVVEQYMEDKAGETIEAKPVPQTPEQEAQLPGKAEQPASPVAPPAPGETTGATDIYSNMDYVRVYSDYPQEFDLDGDGALETLTVLTDDDAGTFGINIEKNGETMPGDAIQAYLKDAFVAYNSEGKPCIVVSYDYASDDYETAIYTFDGQCLACTDTKTGFAEGIYEGVWMLRGWVYTMGTWSGYHKWTISPSFTFASQGPDLWMLQDAGPDRLLSAKTSIDAQFIENGALVPGTIQAGERLRPYATDQNEVVYFSMEDGRKGLLRVELKEGLTYIGGQQDDMVFDNLFYAG